MAKTVLDEDYDHEVVTVKSVAYTVRELSVDENDEIFEASKGPGGIVNDRLNTRLLLAKAIVEPPTTIEDIGRWGGKKYVQILQAFNRMNSLPVANPTVPDGSNVPTSPSSGA